MKSNEHDLETRLADALSSYIDALATKNPPHVEDFLRGHSELADHLRPLLVAAFATKRATAAAREKATAAGRARVTDFQKARTRLSVERGTAVMPVDKRPDVLLLLLKVAGPIWGKTRLQKLLFLVAKETSVPTMVPQFFQHYAYNFGPFDHVVNHDIAQLCNAAVVSVNAPPAQMKPEHSVDAVFSLTDRGTKFADALARSPEGKKVVQELRDIATKYARLKLRDLVKYVYTTYPALTVKSQIREKVLEEDVDE